MILLPSLPAPLRRYIRGQLDRALPPPPDDTPETLEAQHDVAMLAIARLGPMNTAEAMLAVQVIASEAQALSALHEANRHHDNPTLLRQSRAQSAMMTRQAGQARKELRIMQEARWEAERVREAEMEAEEREAAETDRRADETMLVPFMRRLAQRRRDGVQKSHNKRQSITRHSHETNSWDSRPARSYDDPGAATRRERAAPDLAIA